MERRAVIEVAVCAEGLPSLGQTTRQLADAGLGFVVLPDLTSRGELDAARDAQVLIVGGVPVTAEVFAALANLRLVVRAGAGVDQIDLAAAADREVAVANTPDYATSEVADHAVLLMLAAARRLAHFSSQARGAWAEVRRLPVKRLEGSRLGLVGLGRIGTAMAARGRGLGMEVAAYDPFVEAAAFEQAEATAVSWEELLATSDVISVHTPLTDQTRHLFDRRAFGLMRRAPVVVNTARGPIVDTEALLDALDAGLVSAAGLDVIEGEQHIVDGHPLLDRADVVVTPHIGWYSEGSLEHLGRAAAELAVGALRADKGRP